MTKYVRIENADNGTLYGVVLEIQILNSNNEYVTDDIVELNNPTQLLELTLWSGKRLIIYDKPLDKK